MVSCEGLLLCVGVSTYSYFINNLLAHCYEQLKILENWNPLLPVFRISLYIIVNLWQRIKDIYV